MTAMTMTEKILSSKTGRRVSPGDFITVDVDIAYAHDGTAPLAIKIMRENPVLGRIRDPSRVFLFIDHASPPPTVSAATVHAEMRRFAAQQGVKLYDVGEGICHQVMAESGLVRPGMLVLGADSHTVTLGALGAFATGVGSTDIAVAMSTGKTWLRVPEVVKVVLEGRLRTPLMGKDVILALLGEVGASGLTYKAAEFQGRGIGSLSMDSRLTVSNMTVEAGAKAGLFPFDGVAAAWFESLHGVSPPRFGPDPGAEYSDELVLDLDRLEPMVAVPPRVDDVRSVSEVEGVEINQVFIGSCTNGRLEDFEVAARILRGRRVAPGVRCIALPASRRTYLELLERGIAGELVRAGCFLAHSTCGPCIGAHLGLLAAGEVAVSTSNRNFTGRMGHRDSGIYLASPATAAASAVEGRITDPRRYLGET